MRLCKKIVAYALKGGNGYMAIVPGHLPLYWYREVALEEAEKHHCQVVKCRITVEPEDE